ncbi:MAG: DivIVA domain-containing protein [Actinomycetota bacterium]
MSPAELDLPVLLAPEQIRRREFVTTRRGYDSDQVRDYLEQIASQIEDMEAMLREARLEAEAALVAGATKTDPYEELGRRIEGVLRSADQEADRIRREVRDEAQRVLREARADADRIRLDAQIRAGEATEQAERALRDARQRADRTVAGLSSRREELVNQLAVMQERLLGVAKDLEQTIELREEAVGIASSLVSDTWGGWVVVPKDENEAASPADQAKTKEPPAVEPPSVEQPTEQLFTSPDMVDLTFPEIPPLDLGWDDEDD